MMKRSTLVMLGLTGICGVVVSATAGSVVANPSGGALPPPLTLVVSGADAGVPDDAVGLALNVTVTNPVAAGFLTVYPCDQPKPATSNLNYVKDQTVPNMVITAVDGNGYACIDTLAVADVVVDVAGYVPADSGLTMLASPQRFLDTRDGLGAPKSRVKGGTELRVPVAGGHGVPANAGAVVFNATVVNAVGGGFLAVYPCGQPTPATSTVNFAAGGVVPNLVTSALGPGGDVCFFANVDVDIVGDVAGYFAGATAGVMLLSKPERIVDSRDGTGGPQAKVTLTPRVVQVSGVASVPQGASAALVNLTATNGVAAGWLAAYPCDTAPPEVSNLNFSKNQNVSNAAVVKLAADGTFCVRANQSVDVVVDVTGYTTGNQWIVSLPPQRVYDTRDYAVATCNLAVGEPVGGGFRILNLASGVNEAFIAGLPGNTHQFWISPDCSKIGVISRPYPDGNHDRFALYDRAGALLGSFESTEDLYVSDPWIVASSRSGEIYDVISGDTLFKLPPELLDLKLREVSRDGSTFIFRAPVLNGTPGAWRAFTADGVELQMNLPPEANPGLLPVLSPSGSYVAYLTEIPCPTTCGWNRTSQSTWVVATLDGTVISRFPVSSSTFQVTMPSWVSDGLLTLVRAQAYRVDKVTSVVKWEVIRWELFNPPTVWITQEPTTPNYSWEIWAGR
ncbi:MAG: hypothetical protein WCO88_15800 [Actinomycetota bacterium]